MPLFVALLSRILSCKYYLWGLYPLKVSNIFQFFRTHQSLAFKFNRKPMLKSSMVILDAGNLLLRQEKGAGAMYPCNQCHRLCQQNLGMGRMGASLKRMSFHLMSSWETMISSKTSCRWCSSAEVVTPVVGLGISTTDLPFRSSLTYCS